MFKNVNVLKVTRSTDSTKYSGLINLYLIKVENKSENVKNNIHF